MFFKRYLYFPARFDSSVSIGDKSNQKNCRKTEENKYGCVKSSCRKSSCDLKEKAIILREVSSFS